MLDHLINFKGNNRKLLSSDFEYSDVRLYDIVLPALYLLEPRLRKNSRPFSGRTGAEPRPAIHS